MAQKKRRRRKKKSHARPIWTTAIILLISLLAFLFGQNYLGGEVPQETTPPPVVSGDTVEFHFIDVGQGDAALIRTAAGDVLIDASTNSAEDELKAYLDALGVTTLEYAVFTHPHEDHIGGADMVINTYNVKRVLMPEKEHDSKTYDYMMDAIETRECDLILSEPDYAFTVGEVTFTVLAPLGTSYTELNDFSIVLRAEYGATTVMFTGDAETKSEEEILERYSSIGKLDCDILKVGHHGSTTSTSDEFLAAVSPDHAVISVGEGNSHGHPHAEILTKLENRNISIWRTDLHGSIVFVSDGGEPQKR
jgi:beta-lactamase superfamily II metal-dependent hydrolase